MERGRAVDWEPEVEVDEEDDDDEEEEEDPDLAVRRRGGEEDSSSGGSDGGEEDDDGEEEDDAEEQEGQQRAVKRSNAAEEKEAARGPRVDAGSMARAAFGRGSDAPESGRMFIDELARLMYGCGDEKKPLLESVLLVEDIVVDFMMDLTKAIVRVASSKDRVQVSDLLFALRDYPRMQFRASELLEMNKDVRKYARADKQAAEDIGKVSAKNMVRDIKADVDEQEDLGKSTSSSQPTTKKRKKNTPTPSSRNQDKIFDLRK